MLTGGADGQDGGVGRQTSLSTSAPHNALHPLSQFTCLLNAWKKLPIRWIYPEGKLAVVTEWCGRVFEGVGSFVFLDEVQMSGDRSPGGIWRITSHSALQQRDSHCLQTLSVQACQRLAPICLRFVVRCSRDGPVG